MNTITINPISSQRYLDDDIVNAKKVELANTTEIELPVVEIDLNGDIYHVLIDGHHRLEAAIELGINIVYNIVDSISPERSEDFLIENHYGDDYYYVNSKTLVW